MSLQAQPLTILAEQKETGEARLFPFYWNF